MTGKNKIILTVSAFVIGIGISRFIECREHVKRQRELTLEINARMHATRKVLKEVRESNVEMTPKQINESFEFHKLSYLIEN